LEAKTQDWPQWRGEHRDGVLKSATGLNLDWTVKKPPLAWTFRQAGAGYSSPTIVGTTLYCQGAAEGSDYAFALDTETGRLKWKQILGNEYKQNRGNGPRGSVSIDGDKLYLVRGDGQIHCLSAADGKKLWQKEFKKDFDGGIMSTIDWGFSESPLVDGNLVICTPGGKNGTVLALDKNTGAVVWRSLELTENGGYSSPIVAQIDGVRQYIVFTRGGIAGLSANDGKLLWKADVAGNKTAVVATPICHDNRVYVTSAYSTGCALIRLTKTGDKFDAETVYFNKNLQNHHGGVVLINGYIYGYCEAKGWVCQDMKTGEIVWRRRDREVSKGAVLGVGNRLILLHERNGLMTIVAASPEGWEEFGRMELPERSNVKSADNFVWAHPVVADGKLYIRDHDLLFCFDLKN
jgi:outer membrane protein assembly factor BamB